MMEFSTDTEPGDAGTDAENGANSVPRLSFEEARVLGCLLEKEMATPESYPLTMKALMNACNQRSSRDPVVGFDTATVARAMEDLRYKHLAISIHEAGARGAKCKHSMDRFFPYLNRRHYALIAVLLLRGRQTLGELRQRTERMHSFADIESTQAALDELIQCDPDPLVKYFPAGAGRRAPTFLHLFCGDEAGAAAPAPDVPAPASAASPRAVEEPTWREEIESAIKTLQNEVATLKEEVERFKAE